jgi:GNAT superfamily N-acetyltransferase
MVSYSYSPDDTNSMPLPPACTISRVDELDTALRNYIYQVHRALFGSLCPPEQTLKGIENLVKAIGDRHACFLVCRLDDTIVGMVGYLKYKRRFRTPDNALRDDLAYPGETVVEVMRLFVDPQLRSRGVATIMVQELVRRARSAHVDVMYLHTHDFLTGAQQFWEKNGWRVVARDDDEPWNSVHMEMRLATGETKYHGRSSEVRHCSSADRGQDLR